MAKNVPRLGEMLIPDEPREDGLNPAEKRALIAARQNRPYHAALRHDEGLRVSIRRVRGLTPKGLLLTPFYFQAPPLDTFSVTNAYTHTDYDTVRAGQHDRPSGLQLRTVQFNSLFVDTDYDWTVVRSKRWNPIRSSAKEREKLGYITGEEYVPNPLLLTKELRRVLRSGSPFRLIVQHPPRLWGHRVYEVNMLATLRELQVEERAGELDARYVNVSFTEHRTPSLQRRGQGTQPRGSHSLPATVTIAVSGQIDIPHVKNDPAKINMHWLAKWFYGSASEWRWIAKANKPLEDWAPDRNLVILAQKRKRDLKIKVPGISRFEPPDIRGGIFDPYHPIQQID